MTRFSNSLEISVGIHVAAIGLIILVAYYYHPSMHLPPANASLANAIAVMITPPPQPPSPPQPQEPQPTPTPPVPQPPPQAIATQAAQADITTPPPESVPVPSPPQPAQTQTTPQEAAYAQIVSAILEANKRYPREALMAGDEGTVVISFVLNRDGTVLAFSIEQSSGQPIFDQAVKRLIHRVHFPPFPRKDHSLRKTFKVPIQFKLSQ
ncbi:MAG: energy transducer TonB [Gammaproteobacteria bacterium]